MFGRSRSLFGHGYGYGGGLLSFLPIIIAVVLLIIISAVVKIRNRGGILVLKDFTFNENEDEFLKIVGRTAGFFSWLKSLFGKDSIISFICNKQAVKYESSGIKYYIPFRHISCVSSGMNNNPIVLLIFGILFIITGIAFSRIDHSRVIIGLIIGILGILLIILNSLNKNMQYNIFIGENNPIISIKVKGQIDMKMFELASNAINNAVLESEIIKKISSPAQESTSIVEKKEVN